MPLSWEMASGPTVGYEMAGQGSTHVAVDSSEGTTYSNFRLQDSTIRAFSSNPDNPMSANYRTLPFQDNVVRGLSTLSLYGQYNNDNNAEESPTDSHGKVCSTPSELYRYPSPSRVSPISSMGLVESSAFCPHALSNEGTCDTLLPVKVPYTIAHTIADERAAANNKERGFQLNNSYDFFNSFLGGNIDELKPIEDVDLETLSESSVSSGNCMQGASSSSDETLNALDETEIQSTDTEGQSVNAEAHSTVQEGTQLSCSIGTTFHRRRGLSQFYAGKSRSFTCLRDVGSVKDLAKPESPFSKKRRLQSSSSRLPPLQKGSSSIVKRPTQTSSVVKRPTQNCKSTLALAVAMTTREEDESQISAISFRPKGSLIANRSYSLSDLQRAGDSLFFIG